MASQLILLGSPCELHIPYFAMGVPASRESRVERGNIESRLGQARRTTLRGLGQRSA